MATTSFRKAALATALALVWGLDARAQQSADKPELGVSESIVVTGTRQSNRTASESLSPIQLLPEDALEHTGKVGLQEILSNVLPSFSMPATAGGDLTSIVRIATLRGLNPDQVLVLINGKRRHVTSIVNAAGTVGAGTQSVDLNMIPVSAIERIEVLSDGAAAQYGSDAIAGVINIILKSRNSGGSIDASVGRYFAKDGLAYDVSVNDGMKLGADGFLNLSAQRVRQDLTNRALPAVISPAYYSGDPRNSQPLGIIYKGYGIPQSVTDSAAFNASIPIGGGIALYSYGTYAHAVGKNWIGFRAANNNNNVTAIYPNGFEPREALTQDDYGLTVGVKGETLMDWRWDLSTTYGKNKAKINVEDSVNPTFGLNSPRNFYAGEFNASELTTNLDIVREFEVGFYRPLNVAMGIEHRTDDYGISAGQVESYADGGQPQLTGPNAGLFVDVPGTQGFPGYRPQDTGQHSRNNTGGYVDLETSLTAKWDAGLAGRFERYSDFGNSTSGKFSTRYEITPAVAIRGTVSNGFRAPSVGQEFYSASATSQFRGADYNIGSLPVSSPAAVALGAQPLKPETSRNYSAGLVLTPMPRMTLTVDAYKIDINDRIVQSANIGLSPSGVLDPGVASLLRGLGIVGIDAGRYFLNGVNTTTIGMEFVGTYRSDYGSDGTVAWTLAGNAGHTKINEILPAATQVLYGTQIFNQFAQDNLTKSAPNSKLIMSADWRNGPWRFFLRETRFGTYVRASTVGLTGYTPANPDWITDLEVGYEVTKHFLVAVGAQNAFNIYPSKTAAPNFNPTNFNGAQIYNANSPYGVSGGNYYARLTYNF